MTVEPVLKVTASAKLTALLAPWLQKGVKVPIKHRILADVLGLDLGMPRELVTQRIQTAFVNGRPADAFNKTCIEPADVVALSAAMPGLMGAVLRKDGRLAPMRAGISRPMASHSEGESAASGGWIILKLFNLLITECGPYVLETGILMDSAERGFWDDLLQKGGHLIEALAWNDVPLSADEVADRLPHDKPVLIRFQSR